MATYAIQVNGAVINTVTANNNTQVLYTAPAGGYAIVNVSVSQAVVAGTIRIAATQMIAFGAGNVFPVFGTANVASTCTLYVGPSQALSVTAAGVGNVIASVSGVEFISG